MPTYTFDPTGDALQNKVIGETKTLNLPAGRDYLFIIPTYGPYFEESLEIKHTDTNGVSRILEPGVDYNPGFQYVEATAKCNRAIYGGINFVDITLTGTVTYNYQALGGVYELTNDNIANIQANETRDPAFTKWELVLSDNGISVQAFPTIDHPYAKVNVETVKRAVDELEEAGLVVHLRPKFLPNPQEAEYIPSKSEIGLGNVDNFKTANNDEALAGLATNRFMTPATSKAALGAQVLEYLSTMGYNVPVPYAAGLVINDVRDTVSYQNSVYAPRPGTIPFTTNGSFERNKFIIINSHERDHWSAPIVFNITGNEPTALTGAVILQTNKTFEVEVETRCLLNNVIDLVYKTDYQLDNGTLLVEYPLKANDRLEFFVKEKGSKLPNDRHYYKLLEVTDGSNVFTLPDMDFVNANDLRFTLNDFVVLSKETDYTITDDQLTVTYPLKLGDVIEVENIDIIPEMGKQPMREFLNDPGNNEDIDYERLRDAIESQQATITVLNKSLSGKENALTPGSAEQYYRGNKTLSNFASDVRAALLTGLSTATNAMVTATDSILSAIGKLQKQISDSISNLASTATGKGAALVGWKQLGTGAVDRTVDAKLKDFVSVKDFGAKGDGVTDDTVAIQAAINSLSGYMGEVFFPPGNYLVSTLIIKSNISLRGISSNGVAAAGSRITGTGATTLIQASSADKTTGWYNFKMSGLILYGAGTGSGNGLDLDGCTNFSLENLYIQNFLGTSKFGLYINKATSSAGYFSIVNCFILYNTNNVRINRLNGGYIRGGRIANATSGGNNLDIQSTYSITVDSVAIEGNLATDFLLYAYANNKLTIKSCYFEKGIIKEQNNNDIFFINPHLNGSNTTYVQGGGSNSSKNRVILDETGFTGGNSGNLLVNGHFSYWNNIAPIGWTLSGVTVAKASNSEITNSSTCQVTSSSTASFLRQIIKFEQKFLRNGRFILGVRIKGDIDGTTLYSIRVKAHSPTTAFTTLLDITSSGANFSVLEQCIDVAAYAVQVGTFNDIDYVTVDFYPNTNANGTSKTAELDWIVLSDGIALASPIPSNHETYIYYASPDAAPILAANSQQTSKFYLNIGTDKLRYWNGTTFILLN